MTCKKHPSDLSSSEGVCASCLRERLLAYIAAQSQSQPPPRLVSRAAVASYDCPPPLIFPQSALARVSRGKSDKASWQGQNGGMRPSHYGNHGGTAASDGDTAPTRKRWGKLWAFSNFFRYKSDKFESDHTRDSCEASSSEASSTWYSMIFPSRRRILARRNEQTNAKEQRNGQQDCGKSLANSDNFSEDCNDHDLERSPRWQKTAIVSVPSAPRSRPGHGKNALGMGLCLSPLVRGNPIRSQKSKGSSSVEFTVAGERKARTKPIHLNAASFANNSSRKLTDVGKTRNNR